MDINFLNITQENDSVDAIKINNITINDVNGVFQIKDSTGTLKTSEIAKTTSVNNSLSAYATTAITNAALATKANTSGATFTGNVATDTLSANTLFIGSINFNNLGIYTPFVPSGSTEGYGVAGEYAVDANFLYVCHSAGSWIRLSGFTF